MRSVSEEEKNPCSSVALSINRNPSSGLDRMDFCSVVAVAHVPTIARERELCPLRRKAAVQLLMQSLDASNNAGVAAIQEPSTRREKCSVVLPENPMKRMNARVIPQFRKISSDSVRSDTVL